MKKISTQTIVLFLVLSVSMLLASLSLAASNPASVYCEEQGYQLEMRTDAISGDQYGVCVFPDQTECEEWTFYRGECDTETVVGEDTPEETADTTTEGTIQDEPAPKKTSTWGIVGIIVLFGIIMAMPSFKKQAPKDTGGPRY